jgi:YfiH family protein
VSSGPAPADASAVHALHAELPGTGHVLFLTRALGNMSSAGGDGRERGAERREALRNGLGLGALARGFQVHGTVVRRVLETPAAGGSHAPGGDATGSRPPDADGQATALTGMGVLVLTADCLPVALGCEGAVAIVHAGWRGLAAGVLEEGVAALTELAGPGARIAAVVGPGAGACCYEVGPEVHAALQSGVPGPAPIDLRAIAERRLRAAGVGEVRHIDACTIHDERFFSHRREGERAGRQGALAWQS